MRRLFLSFVSSFCAILVWGQPAHADMVSDAAASYAKYLQQRQSANSLSAFSPYLSQEMIDARTNYINSFAAKKGASEGDVEKLLIERTKYAESCIGTRDFKGGTASGTNKVVLTYGFNDQCAAPDSIKASIEEVTMVMENGSWKVSQISARPETPQQIKKVIPLK